MRSTSSDGNAGPLYVFLVSAISLKSQCTMLPGRKPCSTMHNVERQSLTGHGRNGCAPMYCTSSRCHLYASADVTIAATPTHVVVDACETHSVLQTRTTPPAW